ncbi:MAG: hypothetical protein ABR574_11805 [Cryomorphaceae bacterium]|nr:hypothetical protein [Flavobacteriales bacterium]
MKIKSLLTLLLVATAALAFGQLPRIVLQPDGGGNPQVFLNFDDAIAAAESNDRIYLSGGAFQSNEQITLEFPIHFIGAGIHPDSTTVTNATALTTANAIVITNGGSNSTFTGIKFISPALNNIQYGTSDDNDDPTGLYFERCEFQDRIDITTVNPTQQSNSESSFNECIFRRDITGANNSTLNLTKCVFATTSNVFSINGGGLIIEHCVFFGNSNIINSNSTTVRNTIFASVQTPLYQCNGSAAINCTTQAAQFFGNSSGTVTNSFTNVENPFVDQSNSDYDYTDNLEVSSGSVASGGALDGTDMGLYGSAFPAKLGAVPYNPHFVAVEIAPSTDGDGNLPVTIKTQSQTY